MMSYSEVQIDHFRGFTPSQLMIAKEYSLQNFPIGLFVKVDYHVVKILHKVAKE